jgi:hypothetical protein
VDSLFLICLLLSGQIARADVFFFVIQKKQNKFREEAEGALLRPCLAIEDQAVFRDREVARGRAPADSLRAETDSWLCEFFSTEPKRLSRPSRSVAKTSGGQQHRQTAKPSSPASIAVAILRSGSSSFRNCPKSDRVRSVAGSLSRAERSFPESKVNERRAECRASISIRTLLTAFVTLR